GPGCVLLGHEGHHPGWGTSAPRHPAVLGGSADGRLKGDARMARLRTFIAVDIGKAIRGRAVALQETLARTGTDVKWVEQENLHVTMLFLGEVDDRTVPDVCRVVTDCCQQQAAFPLSV